MAKFSLVLPVYNVEKYIDRCLASCVGQSFDDFDIIIVDDCGQDGSIEKVRAWAEKDSRIKVVHHQQNLGTYHARHTGVMHAAGEYVFFLDPDDALEPKALSLLNELSMHAPDILLFSIRVVPPKKFYQTEYSVPRFEMGILDIKKLLTSRGFAYGTPGKAYKRELVQDAFRDLSVPVSRRLIYGEDALLFARIIDRCRTIRVTPERLYVYFLGDTSITLNHDADAVNEKLSQLSFVLDRLADYPYSLSAKIVSKKLQLDRYYCMNKLGAGFWSKCFNYIKIIKMQKDIRPVVKFLFFLLSFGRKSV